MREPRGAWRLAVAFGLLCGIGEGLGLHFAQQSGRSRWPIVLSSGSEVVWVSPLVDGVGFALLGALVLGIARLLRRPPPVATLTGLCTVLVVYDWARLTNEVPRRYALLAGLALGAIAWFLARRKTVQLARAGAFAAPFLAAIAAGIFLVQEVLQPGVRAREETRLPPTPDDARDVIVVVLDTIRSDHLSAYGYARRTTPELEKIAAEGVRFDACFSTSAWTLPSHASMLTGRLAWEHGAALEPLDATWPVLGETLLAHGYRTGAFSGNLCFFVRHYGFGRGFLEFDDFGWSWLSRLGVTLAGREVLTLTPERVREQALRKPASAVTDAFLRWLDRAPERPCFAFLNWFDAHDPYFPPEPFAGRFANDGIAPAPMPAPPAGTTRPWDDEFFAKQAQAYDECVLALDHELGRLRAELERRGRLDRAVLVIVADHGESFGERGARLHRGSLHREQVQVPLVVRAPGLVPAGVVADEVTSVASLPATVLELLGLPAGEFPGPSLSEAWNGGGAEGVALLELARHPWREYKLRPCYDGAQRGLVRGRWLYVWHEARGGALFDRIADPRAEHDLAAERPEVVAQLQHELERQLAERPRHPREPTDLDLSARPDLAGVGYVEDGAHDASEPKRE